MCGLCGALGGEDHWSLGPSGEVVESWQRSRTREYRIRLINRVLAGSSIKLVDFQRSRYLLRGATGKQILVYDLSGIWQAVEEISGRCLDPLDLTLLGTNL